MSLPASVIAFKKQVMETKHVTTYNSVSSSPQTATQVAAAAGLSNGPGATERLSLLVDEGLAVRGPGDPNKATYTLA